MTFFVTSAGPGKGADLGGLAGADAHCGKLAQAAGGERQDLARLSQHPGRWRGQCARPHRQGTVAERQGRRDRQERRRSAQRQQQPHQADRTLSEKGEIINGRGDTPNRHDILTGSTADGRAFPAGEDRTCKNWTSSTQGSAMLGHHDREGLRDDAPSKSWNSSHPSRGPDGGCSQADLKSTGGDGLLYCFAVN